MKRKVFILIIIIFFSFIFILSIKKENIQSGTRPKNNKPNITSLNLSIVGDLLFESPFYSAVEKGYDKNEYFKEVKEVFKNDDLTIGNMEVVIGNESLKVSGDGYNFCAPSYIGDIVSESGFDVLGTANNHTNDRGLDGINSTIDYFKNKNIMTVGTYKNENDRNNFRIVEKKDIKIGFLAYTYGTNIKIKEEYRDLVGLFKDPDTKEISNEYKEILKKEITELRNNVDVVIVLMHWGIEFTFNPNEEQKSLAKYLNELGVDIIIGSHSHSIQPIEEIIGNDKKTLCFYSLGNFTSQDDDIARTKKGYETFDNAYQFGLLATLKITKNNNNIMLEEIKTTPIINYFDRNMSNFKLLPINEYTKELEESHNRYNLGFTKDFVTDTYEQVISKNFR